MTNNTLNTKEMYEQYVSARQREDMTFAPSYEKWLSLIDELENLHNTPYFKDSEYNPLNYAEYKDKPLAEMHFIIAQAQMEYDENQKKVDLRIREIENLLLNPDDLILDDEAINKDDDYYEFDDE